MKIHPRGATFGFLIGVALAATVVPVSIPGFITPAHAQVRTLPADFRQALEPYGQWVSHQRWGEVWVPEVPADWQPYSKGHWVYTEEWGWYWVADEEWGWIPYHYGRWIHDRQLGWAWVPGREWGPAWVRWRRGAEAVGWAPLPPDEIAIEDEVDADPGAWVFVPLAAMAAPRIADVIVPRHDRDSYFRNTVLVNRTLLRERGRIAVNPGVPPSYIAAAMGRPLRAVDVRPRVIPGTLGVRGAIETRLDRPRRGAIRETIVDRSATTIRPAANIPPPQPLARGERGRLGDHPPRAAGGRPLPPSVPVITTPEPGAPATEGRRLPSITAPAPIVAPEPGAPATEGRRLPSITAPAPIVAPERTQRPPIAPGAERPRTGQPPVVAPPVAPQRPAAAPPPSVRQPPAAERTPPQQRIAPPSRPAPPAATAPRPQLPAAIAPRPSLPPAATAPRPGPPPAAVVPRAQPPATSGQAPVPRAPAISAPPRAPAAPPQPALGGRPPDKR